MTPTTGTDTTVQNCTGSCATATTNLTVADVQRVIAQAVAEAQARGVNATIAVVDRVGNVLAVYRMGDPTTRSVTVTTTPDGVSPIARRPGRTSGCRSRRSRWRTSITPPPSPKPSLAPTCLQKATRSRLESPARSCRRHFNPGEDFQPAGPLFGVQFSSLACSDLIRSFNGVGPSAGPQRTPLGLSADPGGFPLYKGGTVVGGVGVLADGIYTIDKSILDRDVDIDEAIALAATFNFSAPVDRRADRVTVDGKVLRFTDVEFAQLSSNPASAPDFGSIAATVGAVIPVPGYTDGIIRDGTAFGQPASGIRPDGDHELSRVAMPSCWSMTPTLCAIRRARGTDAATVGTAVLTDVEVRTLLQSALDVANRARAQIRRPVGSQARVTISVVDTQGEILGIARTRDAPLFGTDVSLQKARTAAFMSSSTAAAFIATLPDAKYLSTTDTAVSVVRSIPIEQLCRRVAARSLAIPTHSRTD